MSMNRFSFILIVFLCFLLFVPAVNAKEIKTFAETKAKIILGSFLPRMSTEVSLDPANPALPSGDLIDAEDDLGLAIFVTPGAYPTLAPAGAAGAASGLPAERRTCNW